MSLLIDIRDPIWMTEESLKDYLQPLLPGVAIYCCDAGEHKADITMLVVVSLYPGVSEELPNLKLVQKLGAGVGTIARDPNLAKDVRIARLKPQAPAQEIAEYCVAYVLREQRNMQFHEHHQSNANWMQIPPKKSPTTKVGVLGLGHIGSYTARAFAALGFEVLGWSRSPKNIEGVCCLHDENALPDLLSQCDYVASILPSTNETVDLLDAKMLANMKPSAILINAGRGDLIVEEDLLDAINNDRLGGAVLDVFREEPLADDHPFWTHPKITITPHVSGWHVDGALEDVAENYIRLMKDESLLHETDRSLGY
ncbi:MAG: glyoxylate/hydroxypyruvate reductase A [Gammaproteobacteria bacterium]|nr:glyoxylate/hydroxypyruvate reductase A [Gammaproteobacteria bacterium]